MSHKCSALSRYQSACYTCDKNTYGKIHSLYPETSIPTIFYLRHGQTDQIVIKSLKNNQVAQNEQIFCSVT